MRHLIVAGAMLFVAVGITFGTASVLQVMAVAQSHRAAETVVVEATKPALKPIGGKERVAVQAREGVTRSALNLAGL